MFDQETLDRVRASVDIAQVVGEYVALKKGGTHSYKGLCPFHKEKTPSFNVNTALQIFKCFGCGAGGNAASFLMRIENIPFPEAVRRLAERGHVPLPDNETPEDKERKRLLQICETVASLYTRSLNSSPAAQHARDYLARRGLTAEINAKFRLGWSNGNEVFDARIHPALLDRAGITSPGQIGRPYDRMRNRLVIPIMDEAGRVIGFGGRTLDPNAQPKYLNSPETPLFSKSRSLYTLHLAKEGMRRTGKAILVEGYFDAIAAHAHGVSNTVAVMGTSLTEAQLSMLKRLAPVLCIVYDEDTGGNESALRGLDLATQAGFEVRIVRLPKGSDPDEFLNEHGPEAFLKAAEEAGGGAEGGAVPLFDFRLEIASRHADPSSTAGKIRIVAELVPFLARVPNAIERHAHVKRLADRLDLREQDIETEISRWQDKPAPGAGRTPASAPPGAAKASPAWRAEKLVLGGVLRHRTSAVSALMELPAESFETPEARKLAERLRSLFEKGEAFSVSSLMDEFQDSPATLELLTMAEPDGKEEANEPALDESIDLLKKRRHKARMREIQRELVSAKDPAEVARLMEEKQRLASEGA
jgi:DNA primase